MKQRCFSALRWKIIFSTFLLIYLILRAQNFFAEKINLNFLFNLNFCDKSDV